MTIMKTKYALLALLAITFWGCDDNTAGLGLNMFTGSDQNINGKLSTFDVTTESVRAGEIYAKTNVGYVGKFTDETFGTYQAGFLAQLNCSQGVTFPEAFSGNAEKGTGKMMTDLSNLPDGVSGYTTITNEKGDTIGNCQINIYLMYDSYFGDSLTACRLSMYVLDKKNDNKYWSEDPNAYYTNIDPAKYYDATSLLGSKSYTAVDLSISDSIRNLSSYTPFIRITLDREKTQELGRKLLEGGRTEELHEKFQRIFPGVYVKSDYGDGTILYAKSIQMDVAFLEHATDSVTGGLLQTSAKKDSVMYAIRSFTSTREVIQANQLENDTEKIQECINEAKGTYLKSPAGIFTQLTLPVSQIKEKLQGDTLNAVKLGIPIYNENSDKKFGMPTPRNVLLIRKKYVDSFFKNNQLSDGITSSLFTPTSSTLTQYTFNNITQMINDCLADGEREKAEKSGFPMTLKIINSEGKEEERTVTSMEEWEKYSDWNKFILIPVLVTTDTSSSGYYGSSNNVISIQHDLKPGYARLKGGTKANDTSLSKAEQEKYKLKLEVVSTGFGTKSK